MQLDRKALLAELLTYMKPEEAEQLASLVMSKWEGSGNEKWFRPGTEFSIENCPKHKLFFACGRAYIERLFMAANRSGKTIAGAYECSCHLTGIYPDWWEGRRFDVPTRGWAAGKTGQTTRDTVQKELLGEYSHIGTGTIPSELILDYKARQGIPGAVEYVEVRHISGGTSILGFKSFDQGVQSFIGTAKDFIWLDEECPKDVYDECFIRTMTTNGILFTTFTPILGITPLIIEYDKEADHLGGAERIVPLNETETSALISRGRKGLKSSRCIVQAGWDDAPWLDEETKKIFLDRTPDNMKKARSQGIPAVGEGNVYKLDISQIICEPFEIPAHYKRLFAMDVGWKCTAGLFGALDPETDTLYIYAEYYGEEKEPTINAERMKGLNKGWIPGVIDPASHARTSDAGKKLIQMYRTLGLKVKEAKNDVEVGIDMVFDRLSSGRLKIFRNLFNFRKEYAVYRRINGHIVKEDDHLMDCMRYLVLNLQLAKSRSTVEFNPFANGDTTFGRNDGGGRDYTR